MTVKTVNKWCVRCGQLSMIQIIDGNCREFCLQCDKPTIDAILTAKAEKTKEKEDQK